MADSVHGAASFSTQANALLRKNLTFQKRDVRSNIRLILAPLILCVLLVLIQVLVNRELDKPSNRCGCKCVDQNGDGKCEQVCGIEYSDLDQVGRCPIPSPPEWPPLLQIPAPEYRAVRTDFTSFGDLPDDSCKISGSCPATILLTGTNQTFGESMGRNLFSSGSTLDFSDIFYSSAYNVLGTESQTKYVNFLEAAFFSNLTVYNVRSQCSPDSTFYLPLEFGSVAVQQEISCVKGLHLWHNSSYEINNELHKGYRNGNPEGKINEIIAAYDFLNSNRNGLNVSIWYNSSYKNGKSNQPLTLSRVPRSVNLVNLLSLLGSSVGKLSVALYLLYCRNQSKGSP